MQPSPETSRDGCEGGADPLEGAAGQTEPATCILQSVSETSEVPGSLEGFTLFKCTGLGNELKEQNIYVALCESKV